MRSGVIIVMLGLLVVAPSGLAEPGAADVCASADAQVDAVAPSSWYEACVAQGDLGSSVAIGYTQTLVSCWNEGRSCSYVPTFRASLETMGAGDWVLRATGTEHAYPSGSAIFGTTRALECQVAAGETRCDAAIENKVVTGTNFQSATWKGTWSLHLVDALGAERLMSTGASEGWLAQYCGCE